MGCVSVYVSFPGWVQFGVTQGDDDADTSGFTKSHYHAEYETGLSADASL